MGRNRIDIATDRFPKGAIGAEVGVLRGRFSQILLDVTKPKCLYLIDPWKQYDIPGMPSQERFNMVARDVQAKFEDQVAGGTVVIQRGTSVDVLGSFPDNFLDWIYIDGDHSIEGVKADLDLAVKKVKSGGIIAGDDYDHPKLRHETWGNGIKPGVDALLASKRCTLIEITAHQYVLRNL